jgi:O-antigen ligase
VANPLLLAKFEKGRVHGTMVYPNALAGVVLLLWPVTFALAVSGTRRFRRFTRVAAIALTLFLGLGSLFWTGSKSGWLIAVALLAVCLFRLNWSARLKWGAVVLLMVIGLTAFGLRFEKYFAAGATSVSARFDYWHAAVQNTREHLLFGSGPGTFQRPYALLKRPESEMARLTHNDYLEQFSDAGLVSGVCYIVWVGLLLATLLRRVWRHEHIIYFAVVVGLLGWFLQGVSEFGLYVPALAWTAFALGGALLKLTHPTKTISPPGKS